MTECGNINVLGYILTSPLMWLVRKISYSVKIPINWRSQDLCKVKWHNRKRIDKI